MSPFTDWLIALKDSDLFLSALGGGLGGGVIGGAISWAATFWQTRWMLKAEREKAEAERTAQAATSRSQREADALVDLLASLRSVKEGIPELRTKHRQLATGRGDQANAERRHIREVVMPRVLTPEIRRRLQLLEDLLDRYSRMPMPTTEDEFGDEVDAEPDMLARVRADVTQWLEHVRETVESVLHDSPPPVDKEPPYLDRSSLRAWQRPGRPDAPAVPEKEGWLRRMRRSIAAKVHPG
ncbi:hypothetical protein [Streptomonospora litoralis]|uniref:Uncharacterized protein n=1 Tax=Streptomonospora litoralis TaxID=2498135 RepID=A0A4P6QBI0_9ACTN|nr:hypothetical protein [Streptomonospora litoralis]QBI56807.1 hypothetical protein EKD16_25330 [Streptomonospora litoralis]